MGSPRPGARFAPRPPALAALLSAGFVLLGTSLLLPAWRPTGLPLPPLEETVTSALAAWKWRPIEQDPDYFRGRVRYRAELHREYELPGSPVEVFVAIGDVRDRRTSPYGRLNAVPGSGWSVRRAWSRDLPPEAGGGTVRALVIEKGVDRRLAYQWYVGARPFAEEVMRSLLGLDRRGIPRPETPIVVRLTTRIPGLDEPAIENAESRRLDRVYERLEPSLHQLSRADPTAPEPPR